MRIIFILMTIVFWCSCKPKKSDSSAANTSTVTASSTTPYVGSDNSSTYTETRSNFDGTYCATVKYSNPNTGTVNYYELTVDITEGYLTKLYFPNGGWLDNSHFSEPAVNTSGFTSFVSDKGYSYDVLVQSEGACSSSTYQQPRQSYSDSYYENSDELSEDDKEEQQIDGKMGQVVKTFSGCDYFIISMNGDYVVAEWMGQYTPDEGDIIRGRLNSYGTKEFWVVNRERTTKLWVDDYMISWEDAVNKIRSECDLDEE